MRYRSTRGADPVTLDAALIQGIAPDGGLFLPETLPQFAPEDFESAETDSFYNGILECGQYTRPRDFRGYTVPEVLLGGNHEAIRRWRRKDSLKKTLRRRPDLFDSVKLLEEDRLILEEIDAEESLN